MRMHMPATLIKCLQPKLNPRMTIRQHAPMCCLYRAYDAGFAALCWRGKNYEKISNFQAYL